MHQEKIKEYIVCINGGTGVIFQPEDKKFTYILTANHVIMDDLDAYDGKLSIHYYDAQKKDFTNVLEIKPEKNKNYFCKKDGEMDIAVLKISRIDVHSNLIISDDFDDPKDYFLVGFPKRRRDAKTINEWVSPEAIKRFLLPREDNKREAELDKVYTYEEIEGHSGAGIFKFKGGYFSLIGIESQIPIEGEVLSRVEFTPIEYFNEIVSASNKKLESIVPSYIKSFSFLEEEIFNIKHGILEKDIVNKLTSILKAKAKEIIQSGIAPTCIRNYLAEKLLLLNGQSRSELEKRKIWGIWLELLSILNIVKDKVHKSSDLSVLFTKVRLFYSNIDEDFWLVHLNDLVKLDYTGLEKDGVVVVSSNIEAKSNLHVLDLSRVAEDIARLKVGYDTAAIGLNIAGATEFPFEKYKFLNISAFKEDCFVNKFKEFEALDVAGCITKLKALYGELLVN